jgi:hypothetical protein
MIHAASRPAPGGPVYSCAKERVYVLSSQKNLKMVLAVNTNDFVLESKNRI